MKIFTPLIFVVLCVGSTFAQSNHNYFGQLFAGDSTFYGDQGGAGECSFQQFSGSKLPWTTGLTGPKFVALDNPLFYTNTGTAAACGLCIAMSTQNPECTLCGPGPVTSTTEYAIVSDRSVNDAESFCGQFKFLKQEQCF